MKKPVSVAREAPSGRWKVTAPATSRVPQSVRKTSFATKAEALSAVRKAGVNLAEVATYTSQGLLIRDLPAEYGRTKNSVWTAVLADSLRGGSHHRSTTVRAAKAAKKR